MTDDRTKTMSIHNSDGPLSDSDNMTDDRTKTRSIHNNDRHLSGSDNMTDDRAKTKHRQNSDKHLTDTDNMTVDRMRTTKIEHSGRKLTDNDMFNIFRTKTRLTGNSDSGNTAKDTKQDCQQRIALRGNLFLYMYSDFSASNMTVPCPHCGSLSFYKERFNCCHNGKVNVGIYPFPSQLETLFTQDTERGKNFRKNIRRYNTAFSFSSFSANLQSLPGRGPRVFRMCGQIYHKYATIYPANNALPPCFN